MGQILKVILSCENQTLFSSNAIVSHSTLIGSNNKGSKRCFRSGIPMFDFSDFSWFKEIYHG